MYFMIKVVLSALIIAIASEVAKRSSVFGALIASLPLTSILAIVWLYHETADAERSAQLSSNILWLVLPSLLLFVVLPLGIRKGLHFYAALGIAAACTIVGYLAMYAVMNRFGLRA
jgi:hypothetical protein